VEEVIRKRSGGWLLFVDFSKAYDSVNRASLLLILRRMGFNKEFIAFVKTALRPYKVFSESLGVSIHVDPSRAKSSYRNWRNTRISG